MDYYCTSCGSRIEETHTFCIVCGQRINPAQEVEKKQDDTQLQGQAFSQPVNSGGTVNNQYYFQPQQQFSNEQKLAEKPVAGSGSKFLKVFVSVIFCLFIFVFALISLSVGLIRHSISEKSLADTIDDIELSEIQVGSIVNTYSEDEYEDDVTLAEFIYSNLDPVMIDEIGITQEDIEEILDDDVNKDFIIDKLNDYAADLIKATDTGEITKKEIMNLIEDNEEIIYEVTGYQITPEDYQYISEEIDNSGVLEKTNLSDISKETDIDIGGLRWVVSDLTIIISAVLAAMFLCLIFLINKGNRKSGLVYGGCTLALVGLTFLISGLSLGIFIDKLNESIPIDAALTDTLFKGIRSATIVSGLIVICSAMSMLIIFVIVKIAAKNRKMAV